MKRRNAPAGVGWLLAAVLLLTLGLAIPRSLAGTVLTIGATDSPPLSVPGGTGILDRVIAEALRRAGLEARFVTLPSQRSLAEANAGTIDGENNRVEGLEKTHPGLVRVPESNMVFEFTAFAVKPGLTLSGWEDLAAYDVGYIVGWKILEENVKARSVTTVATPTELFTLLKNGRVDLVLYERYGGLDFLSRLDVAGGYAVKEPLARREMFLYLNKRHEALAPDIARALREMKADGSHKAFFAGGEAR